MAIDPLTPVYDDYLADPFVWRVENRFYAIGTGQVEASGTTRKRVFPILESSDLENWEFSTTALIRPDQKLGTHFWAPEVAFEKGEFYLYYSVGHEDRHHQLRVARSTHPAGPFEDCAALTQLPECPFAIDPHPFQDESGEWFLFYATDFLDSNSEIRAGTALVVDRLKSMTELAGERRTVLRAASDWQRFQKNRPMYGGSYDWHTVEGPFVWKRKGRYFCFFSGGRWENETYGVDFAVADQVTGPYRIESRIEGPRVLKTIPKQLIGPGHNSVVKDATGEGEWIVFHAWDREKSRRRMHLAKLDWTETGPVARLT